MSPDNAEQQLGVTPARNGDTDGDVPQRRVVEIFGALADVLPYDQPVYRRTITTRPVTFTCVRCAQTVTQQRFPGPVPRYCGPWCQRQAQQAQTRERVRRHRARTRALPDATGGGTPSLLERR
jgi:hypothetical protein